MPRQTTTTTTTTTYSLFSSENFLLAAGGVLFRLASPTPLSQAAKPTADALQICLLHYPKTNRWVLPKGRKDVNESLEAAALREVFEETGYACQPLPCPMATRAPNPHVDTGLKPHVEPASTEPFTVVLRMQKDGSMKVILWYLMRVASNSAPRTHGTQMPNEHFEPYFVNASEAVQLLTKQEYKDVVKLALDLIENAIKFPELAPMFNP